jgi:hypothetical protein
MPVRDELVHAGAGLYLTEIDHVRIYRLAIGRHLFRYDILVQHLLNKMQRLD